MKVSANRAAQLTGKSVPTITRAITKGRLSADPLDPTDGRKGWLIEVSELERVFPIITQQPPQSVTPLGSETPMETKVLEVELKGKDKEIERLERHIADLQAMADELRRDLATERSDRRAAQALLTDQRQKAAPEPQGGLFGRWWGKRAANG